MAEKFMLTCPFIDGETEARTRPRSLRQKDPKVQHSHIYSNSPSSPHTAGHFGLCLGLEYQHVAQEREDVDSFFGRPSWLTRHSSPVLTVSGHFPSPELKGAIGWPALLCGLGPLQSCRMELLPNKREIPQASSAEQIVVESKHTGQEPT